MKKVIINTYQFSELSEKAKEKALQELSNINVDFEWWDTTYEDAANIGLKLTSFDLDRNRHANGAFTLSAAEVAQNILNEHGEGCATYKTAEAFLKEHNPVFAAYMDEENELYESYEAEEKLSDIEQDFLVSLLEDYSIILQHEYDYLTSEEAIVGTIEANEYDFTEERKLF